ncbi:MAG: MFS transporter [Caulobacterales bacterium]
MTAPAAAGPPPLRLGTKVSFGFGAIAGGVALVALSANVLNYFLNQVVGIPLYWVGTLILVTLTVDCLIDLLIGQWSDNLRTRWGRRHPLMYLAAVLWGVSFYFFWHAPRGLAGLELFAFMLTLLVAVRLSGSLYEIPANSLVPELAPHYDDRTGLLSYRWFFLVIGLASTSFLLNAVFLRKDAAHPLGLLNAEGYAKFGVFGVIAIIVAGLASAMGTHSRIPYLHAPPQRRVTLVQTGREMATALTNPALLILMLCGIFGGVAGGLRNGLDNYFYTHFWGLLPQQIGILLPMGVLGSIVAVFIAPILSRRLGKKMTMITFFTFSTIVSLLPMTLKLMGLMPPNTSPWVMVILIIDSIVVTVLAISGFIIISSMVADVVEDNAVKTGIRSEGLLFAANGLIPKFTTGLGIFLADHLLVLAHFPKHAVQGSVPAPLMAHLVVMFLPTYAILVSIGVAVLLFYRIDRNTHEHNLETIRESAALAATVLESEAQAGASPASGVI